MWFKNLAVLRFTEPFMLSAAELERCLGENRFRHCHSIEQVSMGWSPPLGKEHFPLVHSLGKCMMLCLQREEKILPAAVVQEMLIERINEIEEQQHRRVYRREREEIREELFHSLIPRAFSYSRRIYGYIDAKAGWLIIDSANPKKTDEFVSLLRRSLTSLPVAPLSVRERLGALMTRWLSGTDRPASITLESECELRSPEEEGGIVRCRRHDLEAPEILSHLEAGKEAIRLAFTWNERLSLMLDENFSIRRLRFHGIVQGESSEVKTEDPTERFDIDFSVMSLELSRFLPALIELCGGEHVQGK